MVKVKEDLTGRRFGNLVVIKQTEDYIRPDGRHEAQWLCQCDCGSEPIVVLQTNLKRHTRSCGCIRGKSLRKTNIYSDLQIDVNGSYYIGYTTNTNSKFYIDEDDYDKIKDYCWMESVNQTNGIHHLRATIKGKSYLMHIFLGYKYYDHEDRNELNNRKYNLRKCTPSQNSMNRNRQSNNTSGIIGVSWDKKSNKWHARIKIDGKTRHLGYFVDKRDAIIVRLKAEQEYFKEFAPQKHLYEQYLINCNEAG